MGERPQDQTARVRAGYNVLSRAYRADTADEATQRQHAEWLGLVRDRAPAGGDVLDLGCGNGIPAAKWLSDNGFRVTGVDLSDTMVERARELVPEATSLLGDVTLVDDEHFVSEGTGGHTLFVATRTRRVRRPVRAAPRGSRAWSWSGSRRSSCGRQ